MGDHTHNEPGLQRPPLLKVRQIAQGLRWPGTESKVQVAVSVADLCSVLEQRVSSPEDSLRSILFSGYKQSCYLGERPEQMMDGTWRQPVDSHAAHRDLMLLVDEIVKHGASHYDRDRNLVDIVWLHFDRESLELESPVGKAILGLVLSGSVGCLPVIPPHVQTALRRELQVRGLELIGNDIAAALVSPLQSVLSTQGMVIREEKQQPRALPQGEERAQAPKADDAPVRRPRAAVRR